MKNVLILHLLLPQMLLATPEQKDKIAAQVYLESSEVDKTLTGNESVYEFYFETYTLEDQAQQTVSYSIDGESKTGDLENNRLVVQSTAGKHIFQFFYNSSYYEVYSDSLRIRALHRDQYHVYMESAMELQMTEKPVIYLYPESRLDVSVMIDIHGENVFTYPVYDDGWNFTAEPNGDLIFGDQTYNYLFWEASTRMALSAQQRSAGFFVEGKNAIPFLEEKSNRAGFTGKERADFITYWGPRLAQNALNFVHFEFNEACDQFATLDISPHPDQVYRIYMLWGAVQSEFPVVEQEIETIDRSGFSVLEWGGQETHIRQSVGQKTN